MRYIAIARAPMSGALSQDSSDCVTRAPPYPGALSIYARVAPARHRARHPRRRTQRARVDPPPPYPVAWGVHNTTTRCFWPVLRSDYADLRSKEAYPLQGSD